MACMIGCFPVSAQPRIEPADLPILAWHGIPAHEATVERFEELRDAGFTLNFRSFPSADAVAKGLDAAEKAGVKLIIGCPELEKEPEKTVRRFMNHSALAGYFLRDEPRSNEFAELGEWARRIQAVDNEHFCYLNLFPTGPKEHLDQLGVKSYREYVSRFDEQVPLPFLTFDHYPITRDGLKAEWYENLEEFSDEARKAGQAVLGFRTGDLARSLSCSDPGHVAASGLQRFGLRSAGDTVFHLLDSAGRLFLGLPVRTDRPGRQAHRSLRPCPRDESGVEGPVGHIRRG